MKGFIDYLKWLFNMHHCDHDRIRCIHGDEINMVRGARAACIDCFDLFEDLPEYCYYTKEKH